MKHLLFILILVYPVVMVSQETIILGAGGNTDIDVVTSHNATRHMWSQTADGSQTISGSGLEGKLVEASRFLSQSTFGADADLVRYVAETGIEPWLDEQLELPMSSMLDEITDVYNEVIEWRLIMGYDSSEINFMHPYWNVFNYAWWSLNVSNEDKVRQRVAFALSQMFVISINSDLESHGYGLSSYYDVLAKGAFGNYRDLLQDVTLHPCMGFYLSHLNNPRSNPDENIHPDENYAREVQQLFSIGLYLLNQDGTYQTDGDGNRIPTYGQKEIKEFAKVFTGLGVSDVIPNMYIDEPSFGVGIYLGNLTKPMKMYEEWHEPGEKELHNGFVVPAGQTGMEDIQDAVNNLFNHPNVAPFVCGHLIRNLVTSNPTPGYIERVANVFNDNGDGVRGDLKSVVRAILTDPEARSCASLMDPDQGKLREPFVRYAHFASALPLEQYYGRYWNASWNFYNGTGQVPLASPSVFNFYQPGYQPVGPIGDADLVAPEFQIHNSRTGVSYINEVNRWAHWNVVMDSWEPDDPWVTLNVDGLKEFADDPEVLLNQLDVLFTYGTLSDRTRGIIKEALEPMIFGEYREERVRMALYLLMISPDYTILK